MSHTEEEWVTASVKKSTEPAGQLYNLKNDLGEKNNLYAKRPKIVKRLTTLLEKYKKENRSTPAN